MYMQVPRGARAKLSDGKPWLELNVGDVVQARFGTSLSQLQNSSKMSTQYLAYLASVAQAALSRWPGIDKRCRHNRVRSDYRPGPSRCSR